MCNLTSSIKVLRLWVTAQMVLRMLEDDLVLVIV
jgi:hypothetical protein